MKKSSYLAAVFLLAALLAACKSAPSAAATSGGEVAANTSGSGVTEKTSGGEVAAGTSGSEVVANAYGGGVIVEESVMLLDIYSDYPGIIFDGAKEYTVKWGDTLSKIAKGYYGQDGGYYFPLIMSASKLVVADPDKIIPGEKLMIPDLKKNLNDPGARMQLKTLLLDIAHVYSVKADHAAGALRERNLRDRDGLIALSRSL